MKVLVQHEVTGLYYQSLGSWCKNPREAYFFLTPESALKFCEYHRIGNVQIAAESASGRYELLSELPAHKPRRPRLRRARRPRQ
ncbi:MAG: hypothetical protein ACYDH9_13260 [Limisphaerales bacterium]